MKKLLIVTLVIAVFGAYCYSQADYKTYGYVKDSKGKGIPDAKITLKNKENGRLIIIKTNKDGYYEHAFVPHADYAVTIGKEGYQEAASEWNLSVWSPKQIEVNKDITLVTKAELQLIKDENAANEMYKKATEALAKGDCVTARKEAEGVVAKFPTHASSYFIIGHCLNMEKKVDEAIPNYEKVLQNKPVGEDPTYPMLAYQTYYELGVLYEAKNNTDKAIEAFAKAAELKKDDAETFYWLGGLYYKAGKIEEAKTNLERTLTLDAKHAMAHQILGYISWNLKEYDKSIQYLRTYLDLTPNAKDKQGIEEIIKAIETQKQEAQKEQAAQKPGKK